MLCVAKELETNVGSDLRHLREYIISEYIVSEYIPEKEIHGQW